MSSAVEAIDRIRERGESIASDQTQRFPEAASVGDFARQGDVYIVKADPSDLEDLTKMTEPVLQLAPGTNPGSRHILRSAEGVSMFSPRGSSELNGPLFRLECENELTHPEHANFILPPGCYRTTFQQSAEEDRRVLD